MQSVLRHLHGVLGQTLEREVWRRFAMLLESFPGTPLVPVDHREVVPPGRERVQKRRLCLSGSPVQIQNRGLGAVRALNGDPLIYAADEGIALFIDRTRGECLAAA